MMKSMRDVIDNTARSLTDLRDKLVGVILERHAMLIPKWVRWDRLQFSSGSDVIVTYEFSVRSEEKPDGGWSIYVEATPIPGSKLAEALSRLGEAKQEGANNDTP